MSQEIDAIKLAKFDPHHIELGSKSVIVGEKCSGVTTLLCELIQKHQHFFSAIYYFSTCNDFQFQPIDFSDKVVGGKIHYIYDFNGLGVAIQHQEDRRRAFIRSSEDRQAAKAAHGNWLMSDDDLEKIDFNAVWKQNPHALFVFDGVEKHQLQQFSYCYFAEYSYEKITLFATMSEVFFPRRWNVSCLFVLHTNSHQARNVLQERYWRDLAGPSTAQIFHAVLDQCTRDYGCLVLNRKASKLKEKVLWFRANPESKIDFFCRQYLWPQVCQRAVALLKASMAPYLVLDVIDFLFVDALKTSFDVESRHCHYKKITRITALQKLCKLRRSDQRDTDQ